MTKNVAKSKIELIGPNTLMKRRTNAMSHAAGRASDLRVDAVGRDRELADVVEQVVQQDLRRQHRQEREEQRRAGGAEHVPEVRRGGHQDVLQRVGEDPPALDRRRRRARRGPCRAARCRPRPWRRRCADSTEMPTSAACSATASLTPSPRNATSTPVRRATLMMRDFWSGLTRANTVVCGIAAARASSSSRVELGAGEDAVDRRARGRRHTLAATVPLSPVMIFTATPSVREPRDRRRRRRPSGGRRR